MTSFSVFSLLFRASRGGGHCIYFPEGTRVPFGRCKCRKKIDVCIVEGLNLHTNYLIPWILHRCTPESCSEKDIPQRSSHLGRRVYQTVWHMELPSGLITTITCRMRPWGFRPSGGFVSRRGALNLEGGKGWFRVRFAKCQERRPISIQIC